MTEPGADEVPSWFADALAAPVEEGQTEVAGCQIAYRRWGDHDLPGLCLVHGGGANSRWWDHIAPFFSSECCVTALDLSGHGDSGRRPSYSLDLWAREIAAVAVAGSSSQPPVIVAHSMGGFATFSSAARFGDLFEGVIIVDSPVREPSPEQQASTNRQAFGPLRLYPTDDVAMSRWRPVPEQPGCLPYITEHIRRHSIRRTPEGDWTWKFDPIFFHSVGQFDPDTLRSVPCRVAVLRGEFGLVTRDIGQHMYELLGRTAPVIEVPLAYHHMMIDQPLSLVTGLRSLLADWRHSYAMKPTP